MKSLISPLGFLSLVLCAGAGFAQQDASVETGRLLVGRMSTVRNRKLEMYAPPPPPPVYVPPPTPPPLVYAPPPTPPYPMPIFPANTPRPTLRPSPKPSARPSATPSHRPSVKPSQMPSTMPSRTPTLSPTVSHAPSRNPSARPSTSPSTMPTHSVSPSAKPSVSVKPSAAPSTSFSPSAHPTISAFPSALPSESPRPSAQPSLSVKPSAKPSAMPSSSPSAQPSSRPSTAPSSQPTDERVLTVTFNDLRLTLFGITDLRASDLPVWEEITARYIRTFFSGRQFGLLELQASVRIQSQGRRLRSESTDRSLQAGASVQIVFSQTVEMLVASNHIELEKLAFLWLNEPIDRELYLRRLQRSGNNRLSLVTSVSAITGPTLTPPTPSGPFDLIRARASLDGPSMRLIGITNLTVADIGRWRQATIDFVEDYVRIRSEAFGVYNFGTDFVGITQTDGLPQVQDAVLSYNQTFTFSTSDSSKVPELVQLLSSLPFCRMPDRQDYLDRYLKAEGGALENVVQTERVQGTDFQCPSPNEVCAGAVPISANNGTVFGTLSSTAGLDANPQCSFSTGTPRAWFALNGTGDVISISTCSSILNFDSAITVSSGSCINQNCITSTATNDLACTRTTSGAARAVVRTEVGVTYFIIVEGLNNPVQGLFGLTVSTIQGPSNDVCTGAERIRPNGLPTLGSITNATSDFDSTNFCFYTFDAPSVWYSLLGTGEVVSVTTCSPELNFDSALSVSTGTCTNQQCVASAAFNDFGCTSTFRSAARVVFRTDPGVNYFIVVEGLNSASRGQFALTASTVVPVANDVCTTALPLQPNSTILGTITNATGENNFCTSSASTPSVWYKINGTGSVLEISTCSPELNFASAISVTSGSCANQQCLIAALSNNDPCPVNSFGLPGTTVSLTTQIGVTYNIIVEGINAPAQGVFRLSTRSTVPISNAVCSGAVTLQPNSTVQGTITTSLGTDRTCTEFNAPGVWYNLNGTGEVYEITTCSARLNFESSISVSSGSCQNQQCIASSVADNVACPESVGSIDAARFVFRTTPGVTYFIVVEGLDVPVAGVFDLRVTPVTPPGNDLCTNALLIASNNATVTGATTRATYDLSTVSCSTVTEFQESQDVWYRVQGTGTFLTASLCDPATTFDSQLAIYTSTPGAQQCSQTCIATNDDFCELSSLVSWNTTVGVDYLIRVYGFGYDFGPFALRVFPGLVTLPAETAPPVVGAGEAQGATDNTIELSGREKGP